MLKHKSQDSVRELALPFQGELHAPDPEASEGENGTEWKGNVQPNPLPLHIEHTLGSGRLHYRVAAPKPKQVSTHEMQGSLRQLGQQVNSLSVGLWLASHMEVIKGHACMKLADLGA